MEIKFLNPKEKVLRHLLNVYGTKRHPRCAECREPSLPEEEGTCVVTYSPKAWFVNGRVCPRITRKEEEIARKLRIGKRYC